MKLFKKIWSKLGEEKIVGRVATVGCTVLTLWTLIMGEVPATGAWAMGVINGFMILVQLDGELEE
ncbi:MAG: hypothetical protein IJG80_09125 [Selenomonadaceae bacterium]|nr:hypothetical protein [Selenomonadaceae bacterium]